MMPKINSTGEVKIRHEIQPGDIGYIIYLHGILYSKEYNFDLSFETMVAGTFHEYMDSFNSQKDRLWIAELDGEIVGTVAIKGRSDAVAQLRWYLVHPKARGKGVGRALINLTLDFCKQCDYKSIYLHTVKQLEAAAHIYKSVGFKKTIEKETKVWNQTVVENVYELDLEVC